MRKLSFKEQREFESLEKEIETLTQEKDDIAAQLAQPDTLSPDALQALSNRFGEVESLLEEKELRWLELAEIAEGNA